MDSDQVKKGIECQISDEKCCRGESCAYFLRGSCLEDILQDALELLEIYEERIAIMSEGEVLCKECVNYDEGSKFCSHLAVTGNGFGYCSDGRRRDNA